MKWIKRLLVLLVLLVVIAVTVVYFVVDGVVKSVIETQGTEQLKVPTTLGGVSLGLLHGTVDLNALAIGSPPGFSAPQMFSVGKLAVNTGGVMRLRDEPIHISSINIDQPKLVIEQHGTKVNFRELIDNMPRSTTPTTKNPSTGTESKTVKVVIDTLSITNAHVTVQSDLPGLSKPYDLTLPTMTMNNIGNADGANNGAALKDVASAVITKMVDQSTHAGLPVDLSKVLSGNLSDVTGQLDKAAQDQLNKYKVPIDVGGLLNPLLAPKK
jgi:uncharacterized protein involved in outer membrane biogenesis